MESQITLGEVTAQGALKMLLIVHHQEYDSTCISLKALIEVFDLFLKGLQSPLTVCLADLISQIKKNEHVHGVHIFAYFGLLWSVMREGKSTSHTHSKRFQNSLPLDWQLQWLLRNVSWHQFVLQPRSWHLHIITLE